MAYKVIIAEKPSVGKSIAKVLGANESRTEGPNGYMEGNGIKVTWAFGHLITLKKPEEVGFGAGELPMFPDTWDTKEIGKKNKTTKKVEKDPIVAKQLRTIGTLFNGASEIIVATDAGREGELIFRYIYEHLGCTTPFKRLWISSLTDVAIRKGFDELKPGSAYDALSEAAHARSEADWLLGFNASKALRLSTGAREFLSLGRVQTPVLAMICERHDQFTNFVPEPYWVIVITAAKENGSFNAFSETRYTSEEEAGSALDATRKSGHVQVLEVEKKRTSTKPPLLYDLTALQRAANSTYSMTADQTLKAAQKLYEAKLLSYPRTSSRYIPKDVFSTIPSLIEKFENYGGLGRHAANLRGKKLCTKSVDDSKITDHHALLPTGYVPKDLTGEEQKIFDLVCARMLEAFGEDSIADVTNVRLSTVNSGEKVLYKAHGSVPVYAGWKAVSGGDRTEEKKKDDEEDASAEIPSLDKGENLTVTKSEQQRKETKPKPLYTDGTLLGEMETCGKNIEDEQLRESMKDVGLGTPATRAEVIEKLIKQTYIRREGKKLIPEQLGIQIWQMTKGMKIADVKTTGEWERDLGLVERGRYRKGDFDRKIKDFTREVISDIQANAKPIDASMTRLTEFVCPKCGKKLLKGKKGYYCECKFVIWYEVCGKKLSDKAVRELVTNGKTSLIKGFKSKTGKTFDAMITLDREKWEMKFEFEKKDTAGMQKLEGRKCPDCGKELTDNGFTLKCGCGFTMWKKICEKKLTEENIDRLLAGEFVYADGMISSKTKKIFSARLNLEKGGRISMAFDK